MPFRLPTFLASYPHIRGLAARTQPRAPPNPLNHVHPVDTSLSPGHQPKSRGYGPLASSVGLFFLGHLFATYCYAVQSTEGPSMLPTIGLSGDWVMISKLYRRGKGIQVGDMVALKSPRVEGRTILKRVVGMPGDYIKYDYLPESPDAKQGEEARQELFAMQQESKVEPPEPQMIQVPDGHCWIQGDNFDWSIDSRMFGPVPLALINGKIVARVLPWRERCWFKNPIQILGEI